MQNLPGGRFCIPCTACHGNHPGTLRHRITQCVLHHKHQTEPDDSEDNCQKNRQSQRELNELRSFFSKLSSMALYTKHKVHFQFKLLATKCSYYSTECTLHGR